MPDVTIINDLNEDIHVAFLKTVPTNWTNNLKPGERWTTHLASLPLHFEARWAQRVHCETGSVWRSTEFGHNESMEMLATIGGASACGTASVFSAGAPPSNMATGITLLSGPLMLAANAGGSQYGSWGIDVNHVRLCTARVWVPFWNKEYSVRTVEGGGCVLWEIVANRPV